MRNRRTLPNGLLAALVAGAIAGGTPSPAAADEGIALDRFFKGSAVVGSNGKTVRLRYDFSTKEQVEDWPAGQPFNVMPDPTNSTVLDDGKLFVRGMIGVRHVAQWEGDVTVTCRLIPNGVKDIGSYLSSPDQVDDYVVYSIGEKYWHNWDNHVGGNTGMLKFGKQFATSSKGGFTGFRYLAERAPSTEVTSGKPVTWSFGRKGTDVFLGMNDLKLESLEIGTPLKVLQAGFYAVNSSLAVDDVVLEGTLSPAYVASKKLALRTEKPIVAEPPAGGADPAVTALLEGYRAGRESASKLVTVVSDASRGDVDRAAAVAALKAGPRKALHSVIDLLYSEDLKSRVWGIEIVKAMTGKTYGYEARGAEKARKAAVRRLNEDVTAHPELLKGGGG